MNTKLIWHYEKANTDIIFKNYIQKLINGFLLESAFSNIYLNQTVYILNKTIKNVFSNFISHETIVCSDRDSPWITPKINVVIQKKNAASNYYQQSNRSIQLFQEA